MIEIRNMNTKIQMTFENYCDELYNVFVLLICYILIYIAQW